MATALKKVEVKEVVAAEPMMAIPKSKPATDGDVTRIVATRCDRFAITARPCNGKTVITIKQGPDVIAFDALSWPEIVAGVRSALKGNP